MKALMLENVYEGSNAQKCIWGNNFVSNGTICTTLCSAQLKKEIYTYLHIVAILDIY